MQHKLKLASASAGEVERLRSQSNELQLVNARTNKVGGEIAQSKPQIVAEVGVSGCKHG